MSAPADLSYLRATCVNWPLLVHETWESSCRDPQDADDPRPTGDALLQLIDIPTTCSRTAQASGISPLNQHPQRILACWLLGELPKHRITPRSP